ncbi:MAG: NAD(P)-dependent oxidoreductase [Acidimicrobiales bacterium]|nr:NAD(P)-dependent oxidoreductase [Acidimicrobiales bacterium]
MSEQRPSDSSIDQPSGALSNADQAEVTLITGASGFIGRHLVSALAGQGHGLTPPRSSRRRQIHVIARQADLTFEGVDPGSITLHQTDLMNSDDVSELVGRLRPSELFHLAWFNGDSKSRYSDPQNFDWVAVAENLVETFAREGGRRAVLTGSCIEYGARGGVLSENDRPDPDTVYGRCKLDAGQRSLSVCDDYPDLSVAVARVFFVLGRHEDPNRLVPHIIRQLLNNQPAELSSGTQRRDYMHAWDVALGLVAIADSSLTGFVNLGMGSSVSVKELSEIVGEAVGRPDLLWFGKRPGGADAAAEITANISRLTSATNWRPTLDLEAACADVVNWWRSSLNPAGGTAR